MTWHACPVCGLAGLAPDGFSYCPRHRAQNPNQALPRSPLTAIEIVLGREILKPPPDLHDWIRRFGGYNKITAEGWAEYGAAMAEFNLEVDATSAAYLEFLAGSRREKAP